MRVAVSGNFDWLRKGHLHLIRDAKKLGDYLMVILAREDQVIMKKGYEAVPYLERKEVLESLKWVDEVVENVDDDISSRKSLGKYHPDIFARGGDNLKEGELVESEVCKSLGIKIVVGVGGFEKESSSSKGVNDLVAKIMELKGI
jgi:FAD synthetase